MAAANGDRMRVTIDALGGLGDGLATHEGAPVYVPFGLPGEVAECRVGRRNRHGIWAQIERIVMPSPERAVPACRHFGAPGDACGGCSLQHLTEEAYLAFKQRLVTQAASRFPGAHVLPLERVGAQSRRRAVFKVGKDGAAVKLGFYAAESHRLVHVEECPILEPAIAACLKPLAEAVATLTAAVREIAVTLHDSGLDLTFKADLAPSMEDGAHLTVLADVLDLARVSWDAGYGPAPLISRRPAVTRFGEVEVEMPPGSFLQASAAGQRSILTHVRAFVGKAERVADIFSGCGAYAFPLARTARIAAYEGDASMVEAGGKAAARHGLSDRVRFHKRDLARSPLLRHELKGCGAVVINPPRGGAAEQVAALSVSLIPTIVMVSCNPASFARDAKTLAREGYALKMIVGVDQFIWSSHLELVALFTKG